MSIEQTIFDLDAEANLETRSLCHVIAAVLVVAAVAVCFCGLIGAGVIFSFSAGAVWHLPNILAGAFL